LVLHKALSIANNNLTFCVSSMNGSGLWWWWHIAAKQHSQRT